MLVVTATGLVFGDNMKHILDVTGLSVWLTHQWATTTTTELSDNLHRLELLLLP